MIVMIILLILCLPLILMLSLYTTTSMVAIAVDVPVSAIEVFVDELIELDLDKGESYTVDYVISPTEASNKEVRFLFENIDSGVQRADFKVEGNTLIPTRAGSAKVIVETVDGAYRDSFFVRVTTAKVSSISSKLNDEDGRITVGQTTGIGTSFYPQTAKNKGLTYRVIEGESVASVAPDGTVRGIGIGKAKIEVTSADSPDVKSVVEVEVESSGVVDFVYHTASLTALQDPRGEFVMVLNPALTFTESPMLEVFDKNGNPVDASVIDVSFDSSSGRILYEVLNRLYIGTFEIRVTVTPDGGEPVTKSCYVTQISEISAEWKDNSGNWVGGIPSYNVGSEGYKIDIDLEPLGADVTFTLVVSYGENRTGTETLTLTVGQTYALSNGYLSVTAQNSADGAYLMVERNKMPTSQEEIDLSRANLTLSIIDNTNENSVAITLKEIVVFAVPGK